MRDYEVIMRRSALRVRKQVLLALMVSVSVVLSGVAHGEAPEPQRQKELIRLLHNDCGACHGLRLTGGLGPALHPEALQDKTADSLTQVILQGRPGTPMPGWAPFMSESEAKWLSESLVNGVPDEN
jgi:cytochrome c55X